MGWEPSEGHLARGSSASGRRHLLHRVVPGPTCEACPGGSSVWSGALWEVTTRVVEALAGGALVAAARLSSRLLTDIRAFPSGAYE